MLVALGSVVWRMPHGISEIDQEMQQQGHRVRLGVWLNGPHEVARQTVERVLVHDGPWPNGHEIISAVAGHLGPRLILQRLAGRLIITAVLKHDEGIEGCVVLPGLKRWPIRRKHREPMPR